MIFRMMREERDATFRALGMEGRICSIGIGLLKHCAGFGAA
jgi:hypothetical protein